MRTLNELLCEMKAPEKLDAVTTFLIDNDWFGEELSAKDGLLQFTDEQAVIFREKITGFLNTDLDALICTFNSNYPLTSRYLGDFLKVVKVDEDIRYHLINFMLHELKKELSLYNNDELDELIRKVALTLSKGYGDTFTFFTAWIRKNHRTLYTKDHILQKRYTMNLSSSSYDFDDYIQLAYYLFNEEYIQDNEMFIKAAGSKNYTDTWLYLAMHFIRPLRLTDLERIHHPVLPYGPHEVLKKIKNDEFTDNDARTVLLYITKRMEWLPLRPNKTASSSNVDFISFDIPVSCEVFFGKLFALAQAHRDIRGESQSPIIRKVSTYAEINRYMGEDIGSLFLKNDFRARSATKSYLQYISMVADEMLDESGVHVKGYFLAAYARSHKGSYGKFATTTFEYLKNAKLGTLTPEFVAFELLERGVFSCLASMLLKMAMGDKFEKLTPEEQTDVIKVMDLSPKEIENVVAVVDQGRKLAQTTLNELMTSDTDVMAVLHRMGSGEAFSKQHECLCLMSALERYCPFNEKRNCVGCRYEISTRSTFFLMIKEYNRMRALYHTVDNEAEKAKYEKIIKTVLLPKLSEMLSSIKQLYGKEAHDDYEQMLKENI